MKPHMKRDKMYLIAAGLLFIESLAGVVWGIQRGLSSLFAKEILMITSFTQIGMVTSVFGITKALTNLGMGTLSDRVGRKPVIVAGGIVSALGAQGSPRARHPTGPCLTLPPFFPPRAYKRCMGVLSPYRQPMRAVHFYLQESSFMW
jgi:MFS family permease